MTLRKHQLYAKLSNYGFWLKEIFLRHVILVKGIFMDLGKVEAILKWERFEKEK
jgi:hypothetical protein